jgi:hypothetical protein
VLFLIIVLFNVGETTIMGNQEEVEILLLQSAISVMQQQLVQVDGIHVHCFQMGQSTVGGVEVQDS